MSMLIVWMMSISVALAAPSPKIVRLALKSEPPQLNSSRTTDTQSGFVLGHIMEGLTRYSSKSDGNVEAGVAESWAPKGLVITFKLRKTAKWSDGSAVTAQDFAFAWQTVVKPENASPYAFILYPIKNAEAINTGKLPFSELGVKALDDRTLQVTLERPCPYFESLTAYPTYFPIKESFYLSRKDKFAAEASDLLFNGPFTLTQWVHGASLKLEKNRSYWNAAKIQIDQIDIPYITTDDMAKFNLFRSGKLDLIANLGKDDLPLAQAQKMPLKSYADSGIFFMEFNVRSGRPGANLDLRKAIQIAFGNREDYLSKVISIPGVRAAYSLVPSGVKGVKSSFLKENPVRYPKTDLAATRRHLDLAKAAFGGNFPPITLLVNDTPTGDREAQYFQSLFKTKLGLEIKIDKQIFKQRLAKMNAGDFDIALSNWYPDYPDAMAYSELKASWTKTNRGRWENSEYDRLLRAAQDSQDPKKRLSFLGQANQILTDEAALIPTYEGMTVWVSQPKLKGIVRRVFGPDPDFSRASLE